MLLLLALSVLAPQEPAPALASAIGQHFRVLCHFDHAPSAKQALNAAEAVWPIVADLYSEGQGLEPSDGPPRLLELHLYRDAAAYRAVESELTGGLFRRNLAFAHRTSRTAHVALQPPVDDEALERLGLPGQTLRLVAHEAAHLLRYARMPNHALHPDWFVDGNAGFVDQEVMERLGLSPGLEQDPWSSQEVLSLQRLIAADLLPTVRQVFRNTLEDISFYERYALRHFFFRFLWEMGYRDELERIRDAFGKLERRSDTPIVLAKTIHGILADTGGMDTLDVPFRRYLSSFEPRWEEDQRSLTARDDGWLQIGFPDRDATAWCTRPARADAYELRGSFELLAGDHPQLNLHFARSPSGFFSIAFIASHPPTVYRYSADDDSWDSLGTASQVIPVGRPVEFELDLSPGRLTLAVDAESALELELEDLDPRGAWGVAAHRGTAGRWANLKLTAADVDAARGR